MKVKTIRDFENSFLSATLNVGDLKLSEAIETIADDLPRDYMLRSPISDGITFYLGEHFYNEVKKTHHDRETLSAECQVFFESILNENARSFSTLFNYILLIVVRECRHMFLHSDIGDIFTEDALRGDNDGEDVLIEDVALFTHVKQHDVASIFAWLRELFDGHRGNSIEDVLSEINTPDVTVIQTFKTLNYLFSNFDWEYDYGGETWFNICHPFYLLITGKMKIKTFIDSMFSIEHNTGSVFDKAFYYHKMSESCRGYMHRLLTCQDHGYMVFFACKNIHLKKEIYQNMRLSFPDHVKEASLIDDSFFYEEVDELYEEKING